MSRVAVSTALTLLKRHPEVARVMRCVLCVSRARLLVVPEDTSAASMLLRPNADYVELFAGAGASFP
jgi:hypothetical protein